MKRIALATSLMLAGIASAQTSLNIATGLDGSGHLQTTGGLADANWTITNGANPLDQPVAYTVDPTDADWYGGWLANGPLSTWICANPNDAYGNGYITASLSFTLTASQAATAYFSNLAWSIDDSGTLALNGTTISTLGDGNWGYLTPVTVSSNYFVAGTNTLVMTETYSDTYLEAERLQGTVNTLPEPSPFIALGAGCLGLLAIRRRRK